MDDCMSVEQAKRRLKSLSYVNIVETDDIRAISIILKILDQKQYIEKTRAQELLKEC